VDEEMELTTEQNDELMKFETVQTKNNKDEVGTITFDKVNIADLGQKKDEYRRVPVPRNRITPLK
jgi:hypothetical protein